MRFGIEGQAIHSSSLIGPAAGEGPCERVVAGRTASIGGSKGSLYVTADGSPEFGDMGIAEVGRQTTLAVEDGLARGDLDGNGTEEVFTTCASSEGIHFAVWTAEPFTGEPLWAGYYYLG